MTLPHSTYTVGYGKPPLHTRFQKGQSGNPSGKPGPAKLAKQRFQHALFAALEGSAENLEVAKSDSVVAAVALQMARDAAAGRPGAVRMLLSLLDRECAKAEAEDTAERRALDAELLSLVQGKKQGSGEKWLEDLLWPGEGDDVARAEAEAREEHACDSNAASPPRTRNETGHVSLLQGKTQGNGKNFSEKICPVPASAGTRAQLMMSTSAVPRDCKMRFGTRATGT